MDVEIIKQLFVIVLRIISTFIIPFYHIYITHFHVIGAYSVLFVRMFWAKIRLSIFYLASYYHNPILFFALKWSVFYTCHFFVFVIYFFIFPVFLFNTNASKTCTSNDPEVKMISIFF